MGRYFRTIYFLAIALACWTITGCYCGGPRYCCPPSHCHSAPCAPACAPHACCAQPVCPKFWPLNPGQYSEPMYPYVTETGDPRLIPQSGLKTLINTP